MIEILDILPIEFLKPFFLDRRPKSHMAMAHLVLQNEDYAAWVKSLRGQGVNVVLDNSAPYLGRSIDDELLSQAMLMVEPNELVLPDEINCFESTRKRTLSFLDQFDISSVSTVAATDACALTPYIVRAI